MLLVHIYNHIIGQVGCQAQPVVRQPELGFGFLHVPALSFPYFRRRDGRYCRAEHVTIVSLQKPGCAIANLRGRWYCSASSKRGPAGINLIRVGQDNFILATSSRLSLTKCSIQIASSSQHRIHRRRLRRPCSVRSSMSGGVIASPSLVRRKPRMPRKMSRLYRVRSCVSRSKAT